MSKIPSLTSKKLLKILQEAGFEIDHTTGSHYILYHYQTNKRIVIPFHRRDLPKGTVYSILKAADIFLKNRKRKFKN